MVSVRFDTKTETFICKCSFDDRHIPRTAKFNWSQTKKVWYTQNLNTASRLREYFDKTAIAQARQVLIEYKPWTGGYSYPPNLKPLEFQFDAAKFALSRNRSYLALDPGLGKTIVAAVVAASLAQPVVYICPPFLLENVKEEFTKWAPEIPILIWADSVLHKPKAHATLKYFRQQFSNAILIVDEAHRFKNLSAKRTQALFGYKSEKGLTSQFEKIIFLSGTPMPNRPMELFPVLAHCAPQTINFRNQFEYGVYFCAGFEHEHGWDFSGASNLDELQSSVKGTFMLRMKKELLKLPPVMEEMVVLSHEISPKLTILNKKMLELYSPEDDAPSVGEHIATYRRELGAEKVSSAVQYINSILEDSNENLLVFAHHKEVIASLLKGLDTKPQVIDGSVPPEDRFQVAKDFQNNPDNRVLVLQLQAGGIGLNLTKANRVIFVEYSWTPADNRQAIDRAHRIGQKGSVVAQYLVLKNSFDKKVLEVNLRKAKVTGYI